MSDRLVSPYASKPSYLPRVKKYVQRVVLVTLGLAAIGYASKPKAVVGLFAKLKQGIPLRSTSSNPTPQERFKVMEILPSVDFSQLELETRSASGLAGNSSNQGKNKTFNAGTDVNKSEKIESPFEAKILPADSEPDKIEAPLVPKILPVDSEPSLSNEFLIELANPAVYQLSKHVTSSVSIDEIGLPTDQPVWYQGKYSNNQLVELKNRTFYPIGSNNRQLIAAGDFIFTGKEAPSGEQLAKLKDWEERVKSWKSDDITPEELLTDLLNPDVQQMFRYQALHSYCKPSSHCDKPSMYLSDASLSAEAAGLVKHIFLPKECFDDISGDSKTEITLPASLLNLSDDAITKIVIFDGGKEPDGRGTKPNYGEPKNVTIHFTAGNDKSSVTVMLNSSTFGALLLRNGALVGTTDVIYLTSAAGRRKFLGDEYDTSAGLEMVCEYEQDDKGNILCWDKLSDGTILQFLVPHSNPFLHQYQEPTTAQITTLVKYLNMEKFKKQFGVDPIFHVSNSYTHVEDPAFKAKNDGRNGMHSDFWELSLEALLFTSIDSELDGNGNYSDAFVAEATRLIKGFTEIKVEDQEKKLQLLAERQQVIKGRQDYWLSVLREFNPKFELSKMFVHEKQQDIWNSRKEQYVAARFED